MKNQLAMLIAVVVVVVLAAYMFCFQVRYDEVAVVTRFGSAANGAIIDEPGSQFTFLPWPFTKVYKYPTRLQILEDRPEQVQTADGYSVIVQTYVAWRINDPLKFFTKLENEANARRSLASMMSDLKGVISEHRFDQLANVDPERMQLHKIEETAEARLQERVDDQEYGITIERLGIRRILLPEAVTTTVFERMIKTRERLAEQARASGSAHANNIRSEANTVRDRIMSFAQSHAQAIRSKGDYEAARYYEAFAADQDFAIFLRKNEALRAMLKNNTTFVLDAKSITPFEMFAQDPSGLTTPLEPQADGDE